MMDCEEGQKRDACNLQDQFRQLILIRQRKGRSVVMEKRMMQKVQVILHKVNGFHLLPFDKGIIKLAFKASIKLHGRNGEF